MSWVTELVVIVTLIPIAFAVNAIADEVRKIAKSLHQKREQTGEKP